MRTAKVDMLGAGDLLVRCYLPCTGKILLFKTFGDPSVLMPLYVMLKGSSVGSDANLYLREEQTRFFLNHAFA